MSNDLSRGLFPAREVKLLIVDEAHKAQGEYAYCQVAKELNRSQVGEVLGFLYVWVQSLFTLHVSGLKV